MNVMRIVLLASLWGLLASLSQPTEAVALRPGKATDGSVCDLAHDTNAYLGSVVLVPAAASSKDQIDAFFRLAATFVATKCSNGQVLILQGSSSIGVDAPSLTQVANSTCAADGVTRTEVVMPIAGRSKPGFELRCTITKHDDLVLRLADLERSDPMDSLKARMYAAVQQSGQGPASGTPSTQSRKDCGKVTLASLLQGGSCK